MELINVDDHQMMMVDQIKQPTDQRTWRLKDIIKSWWKGVVNGGQRTNKSQIFRTHTHSQ